MTNKSIEQVISKIEDLIRESFQNAKNSSRNRNLSERNAEWWYLGESNAYKKALQILKESIKG